MLTNKPNQAIMHGENIIVPTELPSNLREVKFNKLFVFGHSETGHNHVIEGTKSDLAIFEDKDGNIFIQVKGEATIKHQKSFDIHEPVKVAPGSYRVYRKTEYNPFTKLIGAVRD